jgi:hypothetical protein
VIRWFLTIWERASTPPFTQEVLIAGALSAAGGVSGMDLGAWRWRRTSTCTSSPLNTPQRGYADTREHQLRPVGLATVIHQVSAFLRPETGLYGQLAWPWSLTSPLLRQCAKICLIKPYFMQIFTLANCSGWELRLRLQTGRQAWRLRGARRRLISDVKSAALIILFCWLRLGNTRPGPRLNFSSPPESPMEGLPTFRLTYVPAYLRSGLPTRH